MQAELRAYILENPDRYAINGDTLAKYTELCVKQTSQVMELVKLAKKDAGESEFDDMDYQEISDRIKQESKPLPAEEALAKPKESEPIGDATIKAAKKEKPPVPATLKTGKKKRKKKKKETPSEPEGL